MAERALATAYVNLVPGTKDLDAYLKGKLGDDVDKASADAGDRGGRAMGSSMLGAFKGFAATLGVTLGAVAVVDFVKSSITASSDLNEAFTATNAIFGEATGKITTWAKTAATSLGQSNLQALDGAKTFGIYGQAAGLSADANADFAMSLSGLATDFSSFYNASPAEAIEAIGAALRGENEPIRRFGVLLDDATLKNQALKMGLISNTKDALEPQVKVMAAYQSILEQTGTAQGDFARTSDGLANQQRIATAQFENFKATLGNAFLPVAVAVTSFLNTTFIPALYGIIDGFGALWDVLVNGDFTAKFAEVFHVQEDSALVDLLFSIREAVILTYDTVKSVGGELFTFVRDNMTWIGPTTVALTTFVAGLKAWNAVASVGQAIQLGYAAASYGSATATYAVSAAQKVGALWYGIMNSAIVTSTAALFANESLTLSTKFAILGSTIATQAATAAQWLWNAALSANPIGIVVVAIAALVAGLVWFFTQTELGRQVWENVMNAISMAVTWLWETVLQPIFTSIGAIFTWLYENIIIPIVKGIVIYIAIWMAIINFLYENVIKPVMGLIGVMFTWIYENIIRPVVDKIVASVEAWGKIFTWLYENIVQPVFAALGTAFNWIWNNVIQPVIGFITGAIQTVGQVVSDIFGGIAKTIGDAFTAVVGVVRGPINAVIDLLNGMIESLNTIKIDIPEFARDLFGGQSKIGFNIPRIPKLAKGGYVDKPTQAIIGEAGPEVVTPLKDFERMMGMNNGNGQTVNYYAAPNQSIDSEQQLFTAIKRAKVLASW